MDVKPALLAALSLGLMNGGFPGGISMLHNGVVRTKHPWDGVQLTKSERKGKTPDELQELRKSKWNSKVS